ncbi:asparaginase [Paenibacillaceae bacterium WGS1546]|uniref:asparaginase n=1 Tax=Cohnella sp. WGS1546 TaxID=3366810 RepID=UPI00372D3786
MKSITMPADAPLVVMSRGDLPENVHRGRICVVSATDGELLHAAGDPFGPAYVRSTAKPIQAIASLLDGAAEAYGYEGRHLAMLAASQRGAREQIEALEELLKRTELEEELLAIHPTLPTARRARDEWAASGGKPRKLFHACAGKHLGVLAWCKLKGWPLEGYHRPEHPAQREIMRRLRSWTEADGEPAAIGKDGCGFPVAALPLWRLAFAYGRLAAPELAKDGDAAREAARVAAAMNAHPNLVEGRYRLASALLEDSNVVAKSGAHGVFAFGLRREKLGVAVTIADGTEVAWPHVVKAVLRRIGGVSGDTMAALERAFPATYDNDAGEVAGSWDAAFEL